MSFQIKDLPYAQFEQLGMSRRDVITMQPQDLADLLNGHRTGLISLKIQLGEGMKPIQTQAKLSLTRNPDNTLSLGVHPILAKPINTIEASPEQWAKMLTGEPIVKASKSYNGTIEPHLHQLDKDTKEILSARVGAIQLPNAIQDTVLTPAQKEQLRNGLAIEIESKATKEAIVVRLDLNESRGYLITSAEQAREQGHHSNLEVTKGKESVSRGIKM
jgi:hypothetical protein